MQGKDARLKLKIGDEEIEIKSVYVPDGDCDRCGKYCTELVTYFHDGVTTLLCYDCSGLW